MYQISKQVYNYLLPIYGLSAEGKLMGKMSTMRQTDGSDRYLFFGSYEDFKDAMIRCKYM